MPDFELLLDRSSELFTIFETGGTIRYQNAAINRHCGYAQDDLIDTSLLESIHPADRSKLEGLLECPEQATLDKPIEYRVRHADGSWVWFETRAPPRPEPDTGGYVLVSTPIDDRRNLEQRLEQYTVILDSLDDAVYAIDSDDTIVYVNDAYGSLKRIDATNSSGLTFTSGGNLLPSRRLIRPETHSNQVGKMSASPNSSSRRRTARPFQSNCDLASSQRPKLNSSRLASFGISQSGRPANRPSSGKTTDSSVRQHRLSRPSKSAKHRSRPPRVSSGRH